MHHYRFLQQKGFPPRSTATPPVPSASAFVVCPAVLLQGGMGQLYLWQHLYRLVHEQAQAVLRPSRLERLQVVSCN